MNGYVAYVERGRWLWRYAVQRPDWWWENPAHGLPTRGDRLAGWAFTHHGAVKRARRLLRRRLAATTHQPDQREWISPA